MAAKKKATKKKASKPATKKAAAKPTKKAATKKATTKKATTQKATTQEAPKPATEPKPKTTKKKKAAKTSGRSGSLWRDRYKAESLGPWTCPKCGPIPARLNPFYGEDERHHCPMAECDAIVTLLSKEDLEPTERRGSWPPQRNKKKKA
ncbi:MAG: hypothetical protein AB7N76_31575 [Planctomycetota bacterium]